MKMAMMVMVVMITVDSERRLCCCYCGIQGQRDKTLKLFGEVRSDQPRNLQSTVHQSNLTKLPSINFTQERRPFPAKSRYFFRIKINKSCFSPPRISRVAFAKLGL